MRIPFTRATNQPFLQKVLTRSAGLLAVYGSLLGARSAQAQDYFIRDDFRTNSVTTFRIGGGASLTNASATGDIGYLRLTSNSTNQNGFAISKQTFNPTNGFSISFEYFSYGGTTTDSQLAKADGINLFLIDGSIVTDAANFVPGGYGGSLGYAQLVAGTINIRGAAGGFIGIGLDEFGGYSAGIEGKSGGPGRVVSGVAIRGAGNATTSATAYPYIIGARTASYTVSGGTRTMAPGGFGIDVATARAQSNSPDYRRVFVDVFPVSKGSTTYKVTVRIQNGPTTVSTVIDNYTFTSATQVMPSSLRIGFAASTGGSTNFHEVRDLQIVRPPVANNDVVGTAYNVPISFSPLTNDEASGSTLDVATLDLNPSTVAIDNSLTVSQGVFSVGSNGLVTFTPSGSFSGTFTVPYTVQSILKSISNQGVITVVVSGADVATALNGPTAANVGSVLTYTTTTSNVGVETGSNITPRLVLTGDIVVPNSPAYSFSSTGTGTTKVTTVIFPSIASLSPSDAPVDNTVNFTLTSGSVTGNASFTTSVPDPDAGNNTATLTTTGYNNTALATGCGGPGTDGVGPMGVPAPDGNTIINTYFQGQNSVAIGAKTIVLAGSGTGYSKPIMPGDLVLIMQMQGADMNSTNTTSYGITGSNIVAGTYEYAVAAPNTSVTYAGGGTLVLMKGLANSYVAAAATTAAGPRQFQIIRVPQYSSFNAATVVTTGEAWNGTTGGVLAMDVVGNTAFGGSSTSTRISMTGKGFRGGGGVRYSGGVGYNSTDYVGVAATKEGPGAHGAKGEGIAGTPRYVYQSTTSSLDLGTETYPGGSVGRGAVANAGGGGSDGIVLTNTGNTGGGGGSNAILNANGGKGGNYNTTTTGGLGGVAPGLSTATRLFMGGGGGAGSTSTLSGVEGSGSGGNGGGIVILRTGTVSGTGIIRASGTASGSTTANAAGGGGGGGSVLIASTNSMTSISIFAAGGAGGSTASTSTLVSYGAGGGGSGGVVYNNATSTTGPATTVTGGATGTAKAGANTAVANGNTAGSTGAVFQSTTQNAGISATVGCRPDLDVTLRANTPQVMRGSDMQATYTLTIANSGGAVAALNALVTLANGTNPTTGGSATGTASSLFKYNRTVSATITLADNSVVVLNANAGAPDSYTAPATASDSPNFSNIDLPAGAILTIQFVVDLSTTVENNIDYQSGAQVTYLDPTRTTDTNRMMPGGTYASGGGVAPGINYVSTSSRGEDVSVARPLPVELKQFSVLSIRQDASLTWTTASERNSDWFYVERSLDGANFEVIGSVKAQGYSSITHVYQYVDKNASAQAVASIAYYRLRQVDADGTGSYSPVRLVRFDKSLQAAISMYPNPAQTQLTLNMSAIPAGEYQISILDMAGRTISQFTLAGQQKHSLPVGNLLPGSYIVQVKGAGATTALRLLRE